MVYCCIFVFHSADLRLLETSDGCLDSFRFSFSLYNILYIFGARVVYDCVNCVFGCCCSMNGTLCLLTSAWFMYGFYFVWHCVRELRGFYMNSNGSIKGNVAIKCKKKTQQHTINWTHSQQQHQIVGRID